MLDYNLLTQFAQTDDEIAVLIKASEDGRSSLNDMGDKILRRIIARTPAQRARLTGYNRVYSVRQRRITKGYWPKDAPTASQVVELGVLDKEQQYNTEAYVKAVNKHLGIKQPTANKNTITIPKGQKQLSLPRIVVSGRVSKSPRSTLNVVIIGEESTATLTDDTDYVKSRVSGFTAITDNLEGKQRAYVNKATRVYQLMLELVDLLEVGKI